MNSTQKVTPFFEVCVFEEGLEAAAKFNFYPTSLIAYELPNGFIQVRFAWHSDGGMKYAGTGCKQYAHNDCSLELTFPDVKFRYKNEDGSENDYDTTFEVEIGLQKEDSDERIQYEPLFIENLKYEAAIYFAPRGWEGDGKDWKTIFESSYKSEEKV